MANTVTLKSYLHDLNALLERYASTEVVSHCRYILQRFPQNVATYRLLGKALLQKAQQEGTEQYYHEAAEVFQRVLSVLPNDYVAHIGLSELRAEQGALEQAIWHMERAYEQQPNNPALQDALRGLYAKRGGVEGVPPKLQLTRGALARQHIKAQLYDQALIELRSALEQSPQRYDLKVLLAETLWESQHPIEAGEMAVQILKDLPNCLPANRILAQLWLHYERPSEAQVFLDRVAAIDPYEAARVLQSEGMVHDPNRLERLDYTTEAAAALSSETPDWVQDLDQPGSFAETFRSPEPPADDEPKLDTEALFGSDLEMDGEPDWVRGLGTADDAAALPDWYSGLDETPAPAESAPDQPVSSDWLLDDLDLAAESGAGEPLAPADIPDWLMGSAPDEQPAGAAFFETEAAAEETATEDDFFAAFEALQGPEAGTEAVMPDSQSDFAEFLQGIESPPGTAPQADEPGTFDWFASFDESPAEPEPASTPPESFEPGSLSWLEEDAGVEDSSQGTPQGSTGALPPAENWDDFFPVEAGETEPAGEMPPWPVEQPAETGQAEREPAADELDWLASFEETPAEAAPEPEWGAPQTEAEAVPAEEIPDWLSEAQSELEGEVLPEQPAEPESEPEWGAPQTEAEAVPAEEIPDWLSEAQSTLEGEVLPEQPAAPEAEPEWGAPQAEAETVPAEEQFWTPEPQAEAPDWFTELEEYGGTDLLEAVPGFEQMPPEALPAAQPPAREDESWLADIEEPVAEMPVEAEAAAALEDEAWMSAPAEIEGVPTGEAAPAEAVTPELRDEPPVEALSAESELDTIVMPETQAEMDTGTLDWMQAEAAQEDDWLTSFAKPADEAAAPAEFEAAEAPEEAAGWPAPAPEADIQPAWEAASLPDEEPSLLDATGEDLFEVAAMDGDAETLAYLPPEEASDLAAEVPGTAAELEPAEAEVEAGEIPSWLAEMQPLETSELTGAEFEVSDEEPAWMSELPPLETTAPAAESEADEELSWLTEMPPLESAAPPEAGTEADLSEEPAWLAEMPPVETAGPQDDLADLLSQPLDPFAEDEMPDWMGAFTGETEDIELEEPELALEIAPESQAEVESVDSQPQSEAEWEPLDEADRGVEEEAPGEPAPAVVQDEGAMPDWLAAITTGEPGMLDDELAELDLPPAAQPEADLGLTDEWALETESAEVPDWLSEMRGEPAGADDDLLAELNAATSAEEDRIEAGEVPGWLANMREDLSETADDVLADLDRVPAAPPSDEAWLVDNLEASPAEDDFLAELRGTDFEPEPNDAESPTLDWLREPVENEVETLQLEVDRDSLFEEIERRRALDEASADTEEYGAPEVSYTGGALAEHDDLAHTNEPESEVAAGPDVSEDFDFSFDDVLPVWQRSAADRHPSSATDRQDDSDSSSEPPDWLRDAFEDDRF